ncbi:MAG: prolyl oligopeptidase family serine peptidase [Bacteroidota bacterium]|nr:prolyl oligopeptidase family serine peptidase [Bacteroidota bacterium]
MGTVSNGNIEGQLTGELPAKFYFSKINNYIPVQKNYSIENIESISDKTKLPATIFIPKSIKRSAAIIMMFGSGTHNKEEFYGFADMFASNGIATLVYDKRNVTGDNYPNLNITRTGSDIVLMQDLVDDAKGAFEYLKKRKEINPNKIGLWGISQGGMVAPMLIANNPDIAFVVIVSAPTTVLKECYHFQKLNRLKNRIADVNTIQKVENLWAEFDNYIINGSDLNELKPMLDKAYAEGWGQLTTIPQKLPTKDDLKYNFGYNTLGLDPSTYWVKTNVPTYAVYGEGDIQVPVNKSIEAIKLAFLNKENLLTIKTYQNADHLIKSIPNRNNFDFPKYAQGYLSDMILWILKQQ